MQSTADTPLVSVLFMFGPRTLLQLLNQRAADPIEWSPPYVKQGAVVHRGFIPSVKGCCGLDPWAAERACFPLSRTGQFGPLGPHLYPLKYPVGIQVRSCARPLRPPFEIVVRSSWLSSTARRNHGYRVGFVRSLLAGWLPLVMFWLPFMWISP